MALSTVFLASSLCVPQTQNRPLSVPKSHSVLSPTTSSLILPPQATKKFHFQNQPLKSNRSVGTVKALQSDENGRIYKNVEVFSWEHLHESLAHDVVELSRQAIDDKGTFTVALADTSSIRFLSNLVKSEYSNRIDWSKWQFFWVEEEVFLPSYTLRKTRFFPNEILHRVAYAEFLSMVQKAGTLNVVTIDYDISAKEEAAERYSRNLREWTERGYLRSAASGHPKFDLMLLGMEADGRVGSLIPNNPVLDERDRWVTHVVHETETPRLTLTLPVINSSSYIAMVVTGEDNANAVYSALNEEIDPRAPRKIPAKFISPLDGQLMWYLDRAAASRLFKQELHIDQRY
ncbi:probable 6-phosphogluconolactonase 1 [Prosopis cineraria]|uniref:probable 6-phosphogluconolactonase 1 n=1 Tax=Prosopis cineraria TaxID=364024 RepID=UPI00240F3923|nr:probable 6-phosphogluconolactonase 1 [Prosopis cineraria]